MHTLSRAILPTLLSLGLSAAAHAADFKPCDDAASHAALNGSLCAIEQVPADPSDAAGASGEVSLFVRTFPAAPGPHRGRVWLIAGGPGEPGASFYGLLPKLRDTFPGFELVMPDHRGTGFSTRMCTPEETPASPGGTALAGAEWGSCFARLNANPAFTRQFSQTNAAHDLKRLLERASRRGKTFVYGVSYGTQLVLRTVALGAPHIDGVILDSLVSLQDDEKADLSRRSLVTDAIGRQILTACDGSARCSAAMGEPVEAIYRRVLARAAHEPQLLGAVPGGDPKRFFGALLDVPSAAWQIPYLIKELDAGKSERMKAVLAEVEKEMATLGSFPQSPPSMPLVILISGSENNLRPGRSAQDVVDEEASLLFSSSIPGHLVNTPFPLYKRDALFARLPQRLPPTLVIHGDRDGKTPYDAALRHIEALRKLGPVQLYTARMGGHFVLWSDTTCAVTEVRRFVLGTDEGKRCVGVPTAH
ncbi:alpha/beta fold hydrolase [Massilia sp. CMS3.1]|uniref:alpha/beta hydrolase n=1 Tax=Massilia sp. CMS3.1 TaxID=3373083 RepID=UPI003EE5A8E6